MLINVERDQVHLGTPPPAAQQEPVDEMLRVGVQSDFGADQGDGLAGRLGSPQGKGERRGADGPSLQERTSGDRSGEHE
jgi:hypothetical protein